MRIRILAGQYYDQETGLHYNYHRYYDPKIGRYLTPDPIELAGGINLYVYADLNPINAIDPLGLFRVRDAFKKIVGDSPGDVFTIGFSAPVLEFVGAGFSLDRVILSDGKADWFITFGGGVALGGPSFSVDRGKARNFGDDPCRIEKEFIEEFSVSSDLSLGLVGLEVIAANPLDEQNEVGILKGGLRTGVGLNLFANWTFDLPWF